MSHFAPPQGDPHGLRDAARRLTTVARDLEARGDRVATTATGTLTAWQGSASLLMAARARELRRTTQQKQDVLSGLARATGRYADEVERAKDEVRRLNELWDEAVRRAHQRGARAYDDGSAALAETQAQLQQRYRRVSEELEQDGFSLQRALSSGDPMSLLPPWMAGGAYAGQAALRTATTARKASALVRYSVVLRQTGRYFDLGHPRVAGAVRGSAEYRALRDALYGKTSALPVAGRPLTAAGKVFLPMTFASGVADVLTGGGHEGWRDPATRTAGAVGAAGAGALLISASPILFTLGPVGLAVAGAAVLAYSAWSIGNLVYDHRDAIAAFGARVRDGVVRGAVAYTAAVGRTVAQAKEVLAAGADSVTRAAGEAVETGRRVVDVITNPTRLIPKVAGLF